MRTHVPISIFYDFFLSRVVISFITCCALWGQKGICPFLFQVKEQHKGWKRQALMPLPTNPLTSGGRSTPIPSSALCLVSSFFPVQSSLGV